MKLLLYLLVSTFVLSSCKISQYYAFKKDFSGKYQMDFDLTQMDDLKGETNPDSIPNYFEDFNLDSAKTYFNDLEGISKTKIKVKDNVLTISYKFNSLDALNKSLSTESTAIGVGQNPMFSYNDGIFRYDFTSIEMGDSIAETMNYFEYDVIMEFAQKIKTHNNGVLSQDRKAIRMTGNLGDVAKKEKSLTLQLEFE